MGGSRALHPSPSIATPREWLRRGKRASAGRLGPRSWVVAVQPRQYAAAAAAASPHGSAVSRQRRPRYSEVCWPPPLPSAGAPPEDGSRGGDVRGRDAGAAACAGEEASPLGAASIHGMALHAMAGAGRKTTVVGAAPPPQLLLVATAARRARIRQRGRARRGRGAATAGDEGARRGRAKF